MVHPYSNPSSASQQQHRANLSNVPIKKSGSEFLTKLKYVNTLPSVPVDAKLVSFPLTSHRHVPYSLTSLEKHHTFDIPLSLRNIAEIELIDMSIYPDNPHFSQSKKATSTLAPEDQELVQLPLPLSELQDKAGARNVKDQHQALIDSSKTTTLKKRPNVSWLRKSEHGLSEAGRLKGNFHPSMKSLHHEEKMAQPMTLEKSIELIEGTFEMASKRSALLELKHPMDASLSACQVLPILPDARDLAPSFALCLFDAPPHSYTDKMTYLNGRTGPIRGFLKSVTMRRGKVSDHFLLYYANSRKSELTQPNLIRQKTSMEKEDLPLATTRSRRIEDEDEDSKAACPETATISELVVPYLRDYEYQTKKETEAHHHILTLGQYEVNYRPIYTKLMLRTRRATKLEEEEKPIKPAALQVFRTQVQAQAQNEEQPDFCL